MNYRNFMKGVVAVLLVCSAVGARAARKDEVTLLIVPREDALVQVGLDIANKYPSLLISYKLGGKGTLSLHGWTGTQWVNVSQQDFLEGNFFKTGPDSALIIEKGNAPVPEQLIPSEQWCFIVSKITTTQTRPLLHLVGQYYDFSYDDWKWFSKRYNQPLDAINPEGLNVAWYHKRMNDHFKKQVPLGASDLQYWVSVRQPVSVEPEVPVVEEPVTEEPVEEAAAAAEVEAGNPLTNDVPEAVIMGVGDVPSELKKDSSVPAEEPGAEADDASSETME
jgi:hypothetical protein